MSTAVRWFDFLFVAYAVLSLSSMGGMNSGFFLWFAGCLFLGFATLRGSNPPLGASRLRPPSMKFEGYRFWGWALFGTCMLSLIAAHLFPHTYAGREPDVTAHGFLKIWYLMIPGVWLFAFYWRSQYELQSVRPLLEKFIRAWWIALCFLAVIAVVQYFTGWPLLQAIPTHPGRFHAILWMGHHLSVASIVPFPTFVAGAWCLGHLQRTGRITPLPTLAFASGVLILFLSYARTAWLTLPIGIVLLFARYLNLRQWKFAGAGALLAAVLLSQSPAVQERVRNQMGIQDRFLLWEANIDYFKHRPLTGIGWLKTQEMSEFYFKERDPENYKSYFWGHAHSNFFEMLGGTGILGLIAYLGWTFFSIRLGWLLSRQDAPGFSSAQDIALGLTIGLVLLQLNGLTNVTFWEGKVMQQQMLAVGMLLVLRAATQNMPPHSYKDSGK